MNKFATTKQTRKRLLGTVSAVALLTSIALAEPSVAESDGSNPQVWIELGGGFDQMDNAQSVYTPPFMAAPQSFRDFSIPDIEKPTHSALNFDGSITFQPDNSDWVFSAAVRFGRSQRSSHKQVQPPSPCFYSSYNGFSFCRQVYAFADAIATNDESHAILDFKAGRDVGLGFIKDGTSVISAGLRFAQFRSDMTAKMSSQPTNYTGNVNHFSASLKASRSFTGIGPSLSWDASAPLIGNPDAGMFSIDWGVNAALLFGRQKMTAHQKTVETHVQGYYQPVIYDHPTSPMREKSVTVPNLGGFAGLSLRYANAKISFGYRADMFFSAVDAGIGTRKTYDRGFYGPFAKISIGIL